MEDISKAQHLNTKDLITGIRNNKSHQNKSGYSTLLIKDLKIRIIFKNKAKKEGVGVTDLIYKTVQVLKENLYWIRISTQKTKLIKPVEL